MNDHLAVFRKKEKKVIGILSGTSVDAVDVALVRIKNSGISTNVKVLDFHSYPFKNELKDFILRNSSKRKSNVEDICKLNFLIAGLFSKCINKLIIRNRLITRDIDLIGSHGQTIYHIPASKKISGLSTRSTLQIGDPSVIANITGITTIGDFRTADIAAGGEGAPLVPYLDYILFRHNKLNRAFINIGGIANITFLKKQCRQNEVIAFDCGPGNIMIDLLIKKFYGRKFDNNGAVALRGKVNERLLDRLKSNDEFAMRPFPKSTGREYYSEKFTDNALRKSGRIAHEDIIATFTKFTAYNIYQNLTQFKLKPDEIILSGGGAKNKALRKFLKEYFPGISLKVINDNGINEDNKEAVLFAVLANELVSGNKTNMPTVTGSIKNVFLGKICFA